jgi:hypothetical protein
MHIIFYNDDETCKCYYTYSFIENIIINNKQHTYELMYKTCGELFNHALGINSVLKKKNIKNIVNNLFFFEESAKTLVIKTNILLIKKNYGYANCCNNYKEFINDLNYIFNLNIIFKYTTYHVIPSINIKKDNCNFIYKKKTLFYCNKYNNMFVDKQHNILISFFALEYLVILPSKNKELEDYVKRNNMENILFLSHLKLNENDTFQLIGMCDVVVIFDLISNYAFLNNCQINKNQKIFHLSNNFTELIQTSYPKNFNITPLNINNPTDAMYKYLEHINGNQIKSSTNKWSEESIWNPNIKNSTSLRVTLRELVAVSNNSNNKITAANCKYISSSGILKSCKLHSIDKDDEIDFILNDYSLIKNNDVLHICIDSFHNFFIKYFNNIKSRFILITNDGDACCPTDLFYSYEEFIKFIESDKIIHWYSINCTLTHPKLTIIPFGLNYHSLDLKNRNNMYNKHDYGKKMTPIEQDKLLNKFINSAKPFWERELKCYSNFHFNAEKSRYGYDRKDAINKIPNHLVYYEPKFIDMTETWKKQTLYSFVISPHGNGLDCIRTWEALCLGCIPIVKTSCIDSLYKDLPVLIVKDWSDISIQILTETVAKFKCITFNYEKLTMKYWMNKIYNVKNIKSVCL